MLEIITCPRCGTPAEITERFWLDSTDGPIQHLQTICVSKHWLTPRAETVHQQGPVTRARPRNTAKLLGPAPPAVRASPAADRTAGGHANVPALWGPGSAVPELAVPAGRTRRLRFPI